jgi:hypothetical protein
MKLVTGSNRLVFGNNKHNSGPFLVDSNIGTIPAAQHCERQLNVHGWEKQTRVKEQ